MRGWYRPSDGKWIDIGNAARYDHAAAISDHDDAFKAVLRETDAGLAMLPATVAPEADDETIGVYDLGDILGQELDPNDVAVAMGWVRVNCAPSVTTGPYLHATSEADLKAGLAFVASRGMDLARPEGEGFKGPFSGNVFSIDVGDGAQRHVEYAFDARRRLVPGRVVEYAGPVPGP